MNLVHFPYFGDEKKITKKSSSDMHNLCHNLEKTNHQIPRKHLDKRKSEQMDIWTERSMVKTYLIGPIQLLPGHSGWGGGVEPPNKFSKRGA